MGAPELAGEEETDRAGPGDDDVVRLVNGHVINVSCGLSLSACLPCPDRAPS